MGVGGNRDRTVRRHSVCREITPPTGFHPNKGHEHLEPVPRPVDWNYGNRTPLRRDRQEHPGYASAKHSPMDCDSLWFCHCYSRVVALWNSSRSNARGKSSHNKSDIAKWMAGAGLGHTSSASSRIRSAQSGSVDLAEKGDKPGPTGCHLTGLQAGNAQSFPPSSRFQSLLRRMNFPE